MGVGPSSPSPLTHSVSAAQVPGLTLEAMLRMKALVLVATALRHKAQRWQQQLPAAVVQAADAHWPCPLFWPPQQGSPAAATDGISGAATRPEMPRQAPQGAQAGQAAGAESLPWEELEPVLRRAGALVSPVKQLLFRVSMLAALQNKFGYSYSHIGCCCCMLLSCTEPYLQFYAVQPLPEGVCCPMPQA